MGGLASGGEGGGPPGEVVDEQFESGLEGGEYGGVGVVVALPPLIYRLGQDVDGGA